MTTNTNQSTNQIIDQFITKMQAQFADAEKLLGELHGDESQLQHFESQCEQNSSLIRLLGDNGIDFTILFKAIEAGDNPLMMYYNPNSGWHDWGGGGGPIWESLDTWLGQFLGLSGTQLQQVQQDMTQYQKLESQIKTLDPEMDSLINALNGFQSSMAAIANQDVGSNIQQDWQDVKQYMQMLFTAMATQIQADEYQAIIQGAGDKLSTSELEAFAGKMMQASQQEQGTLNSLMNTMTNDIIDPNTGFNAQYNAANIDHHSYNEFESFFDWGGCDAQMERDDQIMNNASAMEQAIGTWMGNITPALATISPGFEQLQIIIQIVMKDIQKILSNKHLTAKEQTGQILGLAMFLLGFFNIVQQQAETEKAAQQQQMAQGNIDASQVNMANMVAQQEIQQEELHNANVMKLVIFVAQIVIGAIMTVLAPGYGSMAVMIILTVLSTTGGPYGTSIMDELVQDIANAVGNTTAADAIVTAIEVVATVAGGAGLDALVSSVAEVLTQVTMDAVEDVIKTAVDTAVKDAAVTAAKETAETSVDDAATSAVVDEIAQAAGQAANSTNNSIQQVVTKVLQQAAKQAAKQTFKQFVSQSMATQITTAVKGTFTTALKDEMMTAAKAAIEQAANNVGSVVDMVTQGSSAEMIEEEINSVATNAVNQAVADVTSQTPEDVAKTTGRSVLKTAGIRAVMSFGYGAASNGLMLDAVNALMEANHDSSNSTSYQDVEIFMQCLQAIVAMLAQMWGDGLLSSTGFLKASTFAKVGSYTTAGTQGVEAFANLGLYETSAAEATTRKGLQLAQIISELLQTVLQQMSDNGKLERQRASQLIQQNQQNDAFTANNLFNGTNVGLEVLARQAV